MIDFHMATDTVDLDDNRKHTYTELMGLDPVPEGLISLDEMTELFFEMSCVKSFTLDNYVVHVGKHPNYGEIAVSQWSGDDFALLSVREPGEKLEFRAPLRCN